MHIAVDALESGLDHKVGMGHYCANLIRSLSVLDTKNRYSLYVKKNTGYDLSLKNPNFQYRPLACPLIRTYWSQVRLALELGFSKPPDILHVPTGHKLPFNSPKSSVVTIHDLAFLKFPRYFECLVRKRSAFFTRHAVLKAKKIIAISESTKKDILHYYDIAPDKVEVVYHGVDDIFFQKPDQQSIDAVCGKFSITMPFVLYVGVLQPRKNISRLLWAFKKVLHVLGGNLQLVIAGNKGWMYEGIFSAVRQAGIADRVVFTGYLSSAEVICLLNRAKLFALVSLYEGFGLPLLEAMAAKVPVLTSNVSSLPEVAGDAGILADPYDENRIAQAMLDILTDTRLAQAIAEKGYKRAKDFTWEKTAAKTLKVYQSLLNEKK